jgi:hypothetical protein
VRVGRRRNDVRVGGYPWQAPPRARNRATIGIRLAFGGCVSAPGSLRGYARPVGPLYALVEPIMSAYMHILERHQIICRFVTERTDRTTLGARETEA